MFPCFLRAVLSRPMSAAKKEKKKLLQTACHICIKKGCQAACLLCNVAFHTLCDPHDPCPSAPESAGIDFGIQPRLAPCEGKCGSEHAKTGDCGCTDEVCGCGYRFNVVPEFFQRTQHFTSRQHQAWLEPAPPQGVQTAITNFVAVVDALAVAGDSQEPVPNPEVPILLRAPPSSRGWERTKCNGYYPPGQPVDFIARNYPLQLHSEKYQQQRSMNWSLTADVSAFRSEDPPCEGWGVDGKPCRPCADLHFNTKLRDMLQVASGPKPHTPNSCLGFEARQTRLDKSRNVMQSAFFELQKLRRLVQPLYARLSLFDRCFAAIRSNDLPRLAHILKKTMEWGWGLKRIAPLLEDAVRANRMHCGANEKRLAVLLYRVAGPTGLQALHAEKLLPSVQQCTRIAKQGTIAISGTCSVDPPQAALGPLPRASIACLKDEISITKRLVAGVNALENVCDCAPHPIPFTPLSDLAIPLAKLESGEWHIASYAKVTAVARHSRTNYMPVVVSCTASCDRFTGDDEVESILEFEEKWDQVAATIGPCVQYASDGDKRRAAAFRNLSAEVISLDGFLFLQVRVLKSGATVTKDMRHILKRFVRRLFSKNAFRVHGVTIDVDVLCTLAKTLGVARRLANAVKEVDFMSVPNALVIIDCITEIAMADHTDLDSSRHAQARAIWSLHWVVFYARDYYFSNTHALSLRMAYAECAHLCTSFESS